MFKELDEIATYCPPEWRKEMQVWIDLHQSGARPNSRNVAQWLIADYFAIKNSNLDEREKCTQIEFKIILYIQVMRLPTGWDAFNELFAEGGIITVERILARAKQLTNVAKLQKAAPVRSKGLRR